MQKHYQCAALVFASSQREGHMLKILISLSEAFSR